MKTVKKTDIFLLEHLSAEDMNDISKFHVENPKGKGLEN